MADEIMERHGDTIVFDPAEQAQFNVPATTTPAAALDIADGFRAAALAIQTRVAAEQQVNSRDRKTENDLKQRTVRATELLRFSHAVYMHCAPELVERLTAPTDSNTEN